MKAIKTVKFELFCLRVFVFIFSRDPLLDNQGTIPSYSNQVMRRMKIVSTILFVAPVETIITLMSFGSVVTSVSSGTMASV